MFIGVIGWAVVGLIVGFVASRIVNLRGDDPRLGFGVAVGASIVGGALYSIISGDGVSRFNVWSLLVAAVVAVVAIVIWHFVRTRSPYATPTSRRSY
jgi:uncharacterized membrane protein YeaQ/YmgE (transglycosylase-associated protein family)